LLERATPVAHLVLLQHRMSGDWSRALPAMTRKLHDHRRRPQYRPRLRARLPEDGLRRVLNGSSDRGCDKVAKKPSARRQDAGRHGRRRKAEDCKKIADTAIKQFGPSTCW